MTSKPTYVHCLAAVSIAATPSLLVTMMMRFWLVTVGLTMGCLVMAALLAVTYED